jgi:hypothetical protein
MSKQRRWAGLNFLDRDNKKEKIKLTHYRSSGSTPKCRGVTGIAKESVWDLYDAVSF